MLYFQQELMRVINHTFVKIVKHIFIVNMMWHQEELSLIHQQRTTHKIFLLKHIFLKNKVLWITLDDKIKMLNKSEINELKKTLKVRSFKGLI